MIEKWKSQALSRPSLRAAPVLDAPSQLLNLPASFRLVHECSSLSSLWMRNWLKAIDHFSARFYQPIPIRQQENGNVSQCRDAIHRVPTVSRKVGESRGPATGHRYKLSLQS